MTNDSTTKTRFFSFAQFGIAAVLATAGYACSDDPAPTGDPVKPPVKADSADSADSGTLGTLDSGSKPVETVEDSGSTTTPDADAGATTPEQDSGTTPEADADVPPPPPPVTTFAAVYASFGSCTGCHGATNPRAGLNLSTEDAAFAGLIDKKAAGGACAPGGGTLVVPGKPEESLLLEKLKPSPSCGNQMPPGAAPKLDAAQIEVVASWITGGAAR